MIRMKPEDAMRSGLLDPLMLKKLGFSTDTKPRSKRKNPKPAATLVDPGVIPGTGTISEDDFGVVHSALLDFQIMPVPKERPRVVRDDATNTVSTYTPERTAQFHKSVRRVLTHVMHGKNLMKGPLIVEMTFKMPIPKSWPKWRKQAALDQIILPTGRPDMDNLEKALLDAFNEYVFVDDALVVKRNASKIYASNPGIEANITKISALDIHATREECERMRTVLGLI